MPRYFLVSNLLAIDRNYLPFLLVVACFLVIK